MPGSTFTRSWIAAFPSMCAVALALSAPPLRGQACDTVDRWKPWEKRITLTGSSSLGANPYRDYVIRATFHNSTWGDFTQDAFWENDSTSLKSFKIRAALPAGSPSGSTTWTWDSISCTPNAGGACPALTWSQTSGCITVQVPAASTGVKLFDNGFLKQYYATSGTTILSYSPLFYRNDTPFFWLADTAWAAPPREISGQTSTWASYLTERRGKFTAVLVAPAVTWQPKNSPPEFTALPAPAGFSFDQSAGTSADPIPNVDSKPIKAYWDGFDSLVAQANQQDLVVLVGGLIDPVDRGGANGARYPKLQDSKNFARYLAARLANRAVILSPGFDDRVGDLTKDGLALSSALDQVGQAIKAASPRLIVTNHLSASAPCSDYELFRSQGSWMTLFAFQSGHGGGNVHSPAGTVCGSPYSGEAPVVAAVRRSIEVPQTLVTVGHLPFLYGFNSEGPYDTVPAPNPLDPVDNRYRVRQVAYATSLSNSLGFTYGVVKLSLWDSPVLSTFRASSAVNDMANLRTHLENRAPSINSFPSWILNQQPAFDRKMVLGSDGSNLVMAYLPGVSSPDLVISTVGLPGLSCSWTAKWYNPVDNLTNTPSMPCQPGSNQIKVTRPLCAPSNSDCDWLVELTRGSSAFQAGGSGMPGLRRADVWAEPGSVDNRPEIRLGLSREGSSDLLQGVTVSTSDQLVQQNPQVSALGRGFLVVWQAEGLDGDLLGIASQYVDETGDLKGPRMQVNTSGLENQRDPSIAVDPGDHALIAWSSYGQDGDRGGIFARSFDSGGAPRGKETLINTAASGQQQHPKVVALPGGGFVVAWETRAEEEGLGGVSLRLVSAEGELLSKEIQIPNTLGRLFRLADVEVGPTGLVRLDWSVREPARGTLRLESRTLLVQGLTLGEAVELP